MVLCDVFAAFMNDVWCVIADDDVPDVHSELSPMSRNNHSMKARLKKIVQTSSLHQEPPTLQ